MKITGLSGLCLLLVASAGSAQTVMVAVPLERPVSCEAVLTVQKRGCEMLNIYRCDAASGAFFRHEKFNAKGARGAAHADADYGFLGIVMDESSGMDVMATSTTPIEDVLSSGIGVTRTEGQLRMFGLTRSMIASASMTLEPETADIDGVIFDRIRADAIFTMEAPMPTIAGWSMMYHSRALGITFEGEGHTNAALPEDEIPTVPADLIFPGEPGFESSQPEFDCGEFSSAPSRALPPVTEDFG